MRWDIEEAILGSAAAGWGIRSATTATATAATSYIRAKWGEQTAGEGTNVIPAREEEGLHPLKWSCKWVEMS
jgi:hypothetical protein